MADQMKAMAVVELGRELEAVTRPIPEPAPGEVLVKVSACGVCRTDLHVVDGDLADPRLPIIPGHEVVGHIAGFGHGAGNGEDPAGGNLSLGMRVGVPWLGHTCGSCWYCRNHRENLCDRPEFTGYTRDGGYADYVVADARYVFPLPLPNTGMNDPLADARDAPLLCAGLIGYRSLAMAGEARRLGLYGFGAAAHILAQVADHQNREVYAFTRPDDLAAQSFARDLGAVWAGDSDHPPPVELDAAIIFAPVGALVPAALRAVRKGGTVVCGGIHMSDIPTFAYADLWGERTVKSVANLTRNDAVEFLRLAPTIPIKTHIETFPLRDANRALNRLRSGEMTGAAVLIP